MVFADNQALVGWLQKMVTDGNVDATDQGFTVTNNALGIVGGTNFNTDPIGKAVVIAYCILGQLWPVVVPNLLEAVKVRWKAKRKAKK